jgi:hypothetical protein
MVKAYGGMVLGKKDYWHPDMNANTSSSTTAINCYYVDMRPKHIYEGQFDATGIPLLEFDGNLCYFPVTIAQYALGNFDKYFDTKEKKYLEITQRCAEWFVDNLRLTGKGVFGYINDHDKDIYKLKKPWLSSLSQGQAMSVLARCFSVTGKESYLASCEKLLGSFETASKDGGVFAILDGSYFYEEYPSAVPSYVLNGFIFSLWGLLDYYIVSNNEKALKLYNKGIECLEKNIGLYNIGGLNWSRYDLYPFRVKDIASIFYHKLHIEQLKAMYILTGSEEYKACYTRWERAKNNKFIYITATAYKVIHKISMRKESNYVPSIGKEK